MFSRWTFIVGGLINLFFGLLLLLYPAATIQFILIFFGIYAILHGITLLVGSFAGSLKGSQRWWLALGGALSFLVGLIALFYQEAALIIVIYFVAFRALLVGTSELITAIIMRKEIKGEFLLGVIGVLNILFGIFLLIYPLGGAVAVVWILGWYSIIIGLILLVRGLFRKV